MDKLLHTSLYRAILKSLNRKATSEKRLQTYFFEFANEITIICNNTEYLSVLHTLNYTQIQFQYLLFRLPELSVPPPPYPAGKRIIILPPRTSATFHIRPSP